MTEILPIVAIRHGPTDWNQAKRMQGRTDRPLSPVGRRAVQGWRLADELHDYRWLTSPLSRARETAALLGHPEARVEDALIETDWGDWEGRTLAELRASHGAEMAAREALGLDFRPPGGESPRDLQARLAPLVDSLAGSDRGVVAVCHKGVIRALYALASGWDMTDDPPVKLRSDAAQVFSIERDSALRIDRLNLPLVP